MASRKSIFIYCVCYVALVFAFIHGDFSIIVSPLFQLLGLQPKSTNLASSQKANLNQSNQTLSKPQSTLVFDYTPLQKEFNRLASNHCSIHRAEVPKCLAKVQQFDEAVNYKLSKQPKMISECLYNRKSDSLEIFFHHTFINQVPGLTAEYYYRVARLHLLSFLATQNLKCTHLLIWYLKNTNEELTKNLRNGFSQFFTTGVLEFREIDLANPCSITNGTQLQSLFNSHLICVKSSPNRANLTKEDQANLTNFIRFLLLDAYGGLFADSNIIYLKSTRILWNENFASRSTYRDYLSTSVVGLVRKKNVLIAKMYETILDETVSLRELIEAFGSVSLSKRLASLANKDLFKIDKSIQLYHSLLFNGGGTCAEGFAERSRTEFVCSPFEFVSTYFSLSVKNFEASQFFPGAFTFHVPLAASESTITQGSYFEKFEQYFEFSL